MTPPGGIRPPGANPGKEPMTDMSPQARLILYLAIADAHAADLHGIDVAPLTRLDEMTDEEAVAAIDEIYRQIMFDQ